jgi:nicotinamidase-related amidase
MTLPGWMTLTVGLAAALTAQPGRAAPGLRLRTLREIYGLPPVASLVARRTAVVLVDFQEEFFSGRLTLPGAAAAGAHAARLVEWARASGIAIVHVQNLVNRPGSPLFAEGSIGARIVPSLAPRRGDLLVVKRLAGAFSRTDLDAQLRARSIDTLIVAGLMTHLAVAITASDAAVLGYQVIVAADATATRSLPDPTGAGVVPEGDVQRAALAALADRVADVMAVDRLLRVAVEAPSRP